MAEDKKTDSQYQHGPAIVDRPNGRNSSERTKGWNEVAKQSSDANSITGRNFDLPARNLDVSRERRVTEPANRGSSQTNSPPDMLFRQWRFSPNPKDNRPLAFAKPRFAQQLFTLVQSEIGVMQETISLLATEGGLKRISELVSERELHRLPDARFQTSFQNEILPLLRAISHSRVLASTMLESRLAVIHAHLFGNLGARAVVLFSDSVRYLEVLRLTKEASTDIQEGDLAHYHGAWEACTTVFAAIVISQGQAAMSDSMQQVLARLTDAAGSAATSLSRLALRRLSRAKHGMTRPAFSAKKTDKDRADAPTFVMQKELPGDLSADGPRHDNDFKDITSIALMPTVAEVVATRSEYLPPPAAETWHISGVAGMLDRQFRLLREDTIGQLRDAAKVALDKIEDPLGHEQMDCRQQHGARTFNYRNLEFVGFDFDAHRGLTVALCVDQPYDLRYKTSKQRDPNYAYVTAKLVDVNDEGISHLMAYISRSLKGAPKSLVEFPGILLPAFQATLVALQEMTRTEDLPFTELLAPGSNTADVPPPGYATEKGFGYDISCLANKGTKLILNVAQDFDAMVAEVRTRTSLDDMQASAFVSALTQSFALIQGPPGTGKSYTGVALMRALLANKKSASLGPIITVAQTNHALDQLLESLLDAGVTQIIRMGQFSKSDRLRNLNLRCVAEQVTQTRAEKSAWGKTRSATEAEARAINELLHSISQIGSAAGLEKYLENNFPEHCAQLFGGIDDEGFETVNYGPGYSFHAWLSASVTVADLSNRSLEELFAINIHETSPCERRRLWEYWMQDCSGRLHGQLRIALQAYGELKQELTKISNDKDLRVLSQADVVGVTTAGLARNLNLFRKLGSRVLLMEEAAEILESHTLSAMLPSLEHCIQIGDHLQLRPRVANYELSVDNPKPHYAMDISLFERLIHPAKNDHPLPYTTLNIQRRMHPSISTLIGSLYPNLQDHERVLEYPQVMGIRHRLWWLDHNHREDPRDAFSTSFTNTFEVEFCAGLISHLVRQGVYRPADIAVLTP
ncbi:hypothetical protein LTR78_006087 [Recurvomyces mirabilis]|uniref:Uncharacterized protein n=1 Tax=Recurvomyces mirabilis TaxID=574656 RepID=A0AAE1C0H1_9PEZI|nr:hypothetical protein LTR78_006087 [Recurvomyces mirabilis]KAK5151930.1 hypothetical protein LTS14_008704 [Recurvomyces mirabilis]